MGNHYQCNYFPKFCIYMIIGSKVVDTCRLCGCTPYFQDRLIFYLGTNDTVTMKIKYYHVPVTYLGGLKYICTISFLFRVPYL